MIFRYDFGDKLDLSKFRKQAEHYLSRMPNIQYDIFTKDYYISIVAKTEEDSRLQIIYISINDVSRDLGEITYCKAVVPTNDTRFQGFKDLVALYDPGYTAAVITNYNSKDTTNILCDIIKIVHKINSLKVFI
jgi:hypothetical protein